MNSLILAAIIGMLTAAAVGASPAQDKGPAPQTLPLYSGAIPGAKGTDDLDIPSVTVYRPSPDHATGAAVVVCPGGGYGGLAPHEGKPIAEWLNTLGITGVVLKYRLGPRYHHPVMRDDAARAVRLTRMNANEWGLDGKRVGIMGFSAGGHLASTAATHFDTGDPAAADPVERMSSRPSLAILVYPVITMTDPFTHTGSRQNLLGDHPDPKLVTMLSNEQQVTEQTPPVYLVHGADDAAVPVENALLFAMACRKARVPVELHVFEHGQHGFGLAAGDPILGIWPETCARWLNKQGFLKKS